MSATELQRVADDMVRRAEQNGYVVASEIRAALIAAGLAATRWKDVVALARPPLRLRQGRYYHDGAVPPSARAAHDPQRRVKRAVGLLARAYRALASAQERRETRRSDFMVPVQVQLEDGTVHRLLSRDISTSGIRLVGTRRLLGHKVKVVIGQPGELAAPALPGGQRWAFVVRILWTCAVGDDLFENGGLFLDVEAVTGEKA